VARPPGGWFAPWPNVFQIAAVLNGPWALGGGLMVELHALAGGLAPIRSTDDVDLLIDLQTTASLSTRTQNALQSLGYELIEPLGRGSPASRFERGEDRVDVLVADHLPIRLKPRLGRHPAFGAPEEHRPSGDCRPSRSRSTTPQPPPSPSPICWVR
jgi:hypothetical protein